MLDKLNQEYSSHSSFEEFEFFEKDENGNIIAVLFGTLVYKSAYIDQLWIAPEHRSLHFFKKLKKVFLIMRETKDARW